MRLQPVISWTVLGCLFGLSEKPARAQTCNSAPLAVADSVQVSTGVAAFVDVLANDSDADGDPLTVTLLGQPGQGQLTNHRDGTFTYIPSATFPGSDQFSYRVSDGTTNRSALVTLVGDAAPPTGPDANDDHLETTEDTTLPIIIATDLLANDTGEGLRLLSYTQPAHGVVQASFHACCLDYVPQAGYTGSDTFTYEVEDENGLTDQAAVHMTVSPALPEPPSSPPVADFNGDGSSDVVLYNFGAWQFYDLGTSSYQGGIWTGGDVECIPAAADFDGDGATDLAQLCGPYFHFYTNEGSYLKGIWVGDYASQVPVPADYDGDGRADVVVYRKGGWHFFDYDSGSKVKGVWTGNPGGQCIPAPMDYDGDGVTDLSQLCQGAWRFYDPSGTQVNAIWVGHQEGDQPVPGHYLGTGAEEAVVYRGGAWHFYDFNGNHLKGVWTGVPPNRHGEPNMAAPIDHDGDGLLELSVYAGGAWHFYRDDGGYNGGIWTGSAPGRLPVSRRHLGTHPSIAVADRFGNQGPDRDRGDALNGTAAEVGGRDWTANPWVVMGLRSVSNSPGGQAASVGSVPFELSENLGRQVVTVDADINPTGANWIGIGLSSNALGYYWDVGQVWALLRPNGTVSVSANGTAITMLNAVSVPVFHPGASNRVTIVYDAGTNEVSVSVNYRLVLNRYDLDAHGFSPTIHHAGFHMYNTQGTVGEMKLDRFMVTVNP